MSVNYANVAGGASGGAHPFQISSWRNWIKGTATAASAESPLPSVPQNNGRLLEWEVVAVVNLGTEDIYINFGPTGLTAPNPAANSGDGAIIRSGEWIFHRIQENDTHFIARSVADTAFRIHGIG